MRRHAAAISFWTMVGMLAVSVALTIVGSSINLNVVLNIGIIAWLGTSFLFFLWLVIWIWSRSKTYKQYK